MRKPLFAVLLLISVVARSEYKEPAYPDNFSLTLIRTGCFGRCPVYRITVEAQGLVAFEPEKFTEVSERQTFKLPAHKVWQLAHALEEAWFFERPTAYEPGKANCRRKRFRTDHPGFEISASVAKQKNPVRINTGCLEVDQTLISLPAAMEQILGVEEFIYGKKT